jgi:HPr kinase/phosphorylase
MDDLACERPAIQVRAFLSEEAAELGLRLRAGAAGLDREIFIPRIQKPGLALAGFLEYIHPGRVQIMGQSEIMFLEGLQPQKRHRVLTDVCSRDVGCFVITRGLTPPPELVELADELGVPLLVTRIVSSDLIEGITLFLEEQLAPRLSLHGVFLDIYGLGVLLLGESGVGKSEAALDLVVRGHRLVSDDTVEIRRQGKVLNGSGADLTRYHMELRGLGLINIKDLFGVSSVRRNKDLDLIISLDRWKEGKEYDRLGLEEKTYELLGVSLPHLEMPVAPGRNLAVLIEVGTRNHLLRLKGYDPARDLADRLQKKLTDGAADES